jgi:hypothetical protein
MGMLGALFGLSDEQEAFARTSRCPKGHLLLGTLRLTDSKGQPVGILTPYPLMDKGTVAECPTGGEKWPVFRGAAPVHQAPMGWEVVAVEETVRFEKPVGRDERILDASRSNATATRSLSFSREWTETVSVESEKTQTMGGGISLSMADLIKLEGSAETALKSHYGVSSQRRQTSTEEVSLTVPAGTRLKIILHWKELWQGGSVRLRNVSGAEVRVPFAVRSGITFDQETIDE